MAAKRWPTVLTKTILARSPATSISMTCAMLAGAISIIIAIRWHYSARRAHQTNVLWDKEAAGGGDTHLAASHVRAESPGREENLFPSSTSSQQDDGAPLIRRGVDRKIRLHAETPGLGVVDLGTHFRIAIPAEYRVGHEAHFAQVTKQFLRYVRGQVTLPAWEKPNMLAKYFITTRGVEVSRKGGKLL